MVVHSRLEARTLRSQHQNETSKIASYGTNMKIAVSRSCPLFELRLTTWLRNLEFRIMTMLLASMST